MSETPGGTPAGNDEPDELGNYPIDCTTCGAPLEFGVPESEPHREQGLDGGTTVGIVARCTDPKCVTRQTGGPSPVRRPDQEHVLRQADEGDGS